VPPTTSDRLQILFLYKLVPFNQYLTQPVTSQASNKLIFQIRPVALPLCLQHTQEVRESYFTGECIVLNLTEAMRMCELGVGEEQAVRYCMYPLSVV